MQKRSPAAGHEGELIVIPASVVILTKNEAIGIARTISHLSRFDEVIVVDSASTDDTVSIAEASGARTVNFIWSGGYPKKKQWALENCGARNDWILLLDADEHPSTDLVNEIDKLLSETGGPGVGAYDIHLRYRFAGRVLQHGHRVIKRSFLHRHRTAFPEVDDLGAPGIREVEGHYQPQTSAGTGTLNGVLFHDDRDPISTWFERHNRYSDWEAHLRLQPSARRAIAGKRSRNGQLFDRLPGKPLLFFTYGYVARLGFLDGRAGFDYHFALAAYYWQIGVKERDLRRSLEHAATERSGDSGRPH